MPFNTSCIIATPSKILCPFIKPVCTFSISLPITLANLIVRIFVIIL
uniref:Uncharacterized protein n=1 Tax=Arundo donax TaxID=35708 RepID=A0A0A8YB24_ARUDO